MTTPNFQISVSQRERMNTSMEVSLRAISTNQIEAIDLTNSTEGFEREDFQKLKNYIDHLRNGYIKSIEKEKARHFETKNLKKIRIGETALHTTGHVQTIYSLLPTYYAKDKEEIIFNTIVCSIVGLASDYYTYNNCSSAEKIKSLDITFKNEKNKIHKIADNLIIKISELYAERMEKIIADNESQISELNDSIGQLNLRMNRVDDRSEKMQNYFLAFVRALENTNTRQPLAQLAPVPPREMTNDGFEHVIHPDQQSTSDDNGPSYTGSPSDLSPVFYMELSELEFQQQQDRG